MGNINCQESRTNVPESEFEDVPFVKFLYFVFPRMSGDNWFSKAIPISVVVFRIFCDVCRAMFILFVNFPNPLRFLIAQGSFMCVARSTQVLFFLVWSSSKLDHKYYAARSEGRRTMLSHVCARTEPGTQAVWNETDSDDWQAVNESAASPPTVISLWRRIVMLKCPVPFCSQCTLDS